MFPWMRCMAVIFALTAGLISLSVFALPGFALSDSEVDTLVMIYRRGRYAAAEALGQVLLEKDPRNLRVHYYLGNTYIKLGRPEDAEKHYVFCIEKGQGTKLAELSQTGLNRIEENRSPTTLPSSSRRLLMAALGAKDARSMYGRIKQDTEQARAALNIETEEARRRVCERFGVRSGTTTVSGDRSAEFAKEMDYIDYNYKRKLDSINSREINLLSQTNAGHQRTRLMPLGSGMYVQNYVNYGDETDVVEIPAKPPLKATAGVLDKPGPKVNAVQPTKKVSKTNKPVSQAKH